MKIGFYLHEGVEILDFAGPMEVFACSGFEVFTFSNHPSPVKAQANLKIVVDYTLDNVPEADIWAFFGGNSDLPVNDSTLIAWIKVHVPNTRYIFSVCTGARILAKAGLLDGLKATTFHSEIERLQQEHPKVQVLENVRFVDNGQIITTAGVSAGIDGALHLVGKIKGRQAVVDAVNYMEYEGWKENQGLIL
jgi:transcriptional regulator GlxA family with amidase domain